MKRCRIFNAPRWLGVILGAVCLFLDARAWAEGSVAGTVRDEAGQPIAAAKVYLGKGNDAVIVSCDGSGRYAFADVKPDTYDYLAVSVPLDGKRFPYLFARHGLAVKDGESVRVDVDYRAVQPARIPAPPGNAPPTMRGPDQKLRTRFYDVSIHNPFDWHWEKQRVGFRVDVGGQGTADSMLVYDTQMGSLVPHQVSEPVLMPGSKELLRQATVHFFAEVRPESRPRWRIYFDKEGSATAGASPLTVSSEGESVIISTDKLAARLPSGIKQWKGGIPLAQAPAPLQAVRGPDAVWRGAGRLVADWQVIGFEARVLRQGPIFVDYQVSYQFADGRRYRIAFRFEAGQRYLTAREESDGLAGAAWEFSVQPGFAPDLGFEIRGEPKPQPLAKEANQTLCQIANYMHIHPYGYGVTGSRKEINDCLAVFSVNRGSWVDRRYALETWTPVRSHPDGQMLLPWPWYYGSRHSAIHVEQRSGAKPDLYFRFPFHEGTREWGLTLYPKQWNEEVTTWYKITDEAREHMRSLKVPDAAVAKLETVARKYPFGPEKELHAELSKILAGPERSHQDTLQRFAGHRRTAAWHIRYRMVVQVGDLPLDKFKDYVLDWGPKPVQRPMLNYRLRDLPRMRENLKHPFFAALWEQTTSPAFRAFVSGDPRLAWQAKHGRWEHYRLFHNHLLNYWGTHTILGHELGHNPYNQVSVRGLTDVCDNYDLLEPSGLFTPDELAQMRAALALAAYRFNDPNFMPQQYNPGQQDFDAARLAGVASVGFSLPDHPEAGAWVKENIRRLHDLLYVWQLPGGKWPENPPCYYQQTFCNFTYVAHQALMAGNDEVLRSADFQHFVRWTFALLTPPQPSDPLVLAKGLPAGTPYERIVRTRQIPPVGDHANTCGVEIKYDVALLARDFARAAPELAAELMWAFNRGGAPALLQRGKPPRAGAQMITPHLLLAALEPKDLDREKAPLLDSAILPGFGAVLRAGVGTPHESSVLFRSGSSGVRYGQWGDNTFIYHGRGVPLAIDGGEGQGVSTLLREDGKSFFGGRVALLRAFPHLDYVVGQSPFSSPEMRRHFLLLKNEYLIVADEMLRPQPTVWLLSVLADQVESKEDLVRFTGRLGVDLDVHLVGAAKLPREIVRSRLEQPGVAAIDLQRLRVSVPKGNSLTAVLLPYDHDKRGEPARVENGGAGFRVKRGAAEDLVFVGAATAFDSASLRFHGRCAVVQRRTDGVRWHLLDGQILKAEGLTLSSTGASVSIWRRQDGSFVGQTEGAASTVFLDVPEIRTVRLVVDGHAAAARFLDGRLMLNLSEGKHHFELHQGK